MFHSKCYFEVAGLTQPIGARRLKGELCLKSVKKSFRDQYLELKYKDISLVPITLPLEFVHDNGKFEVNLKLTSQMKYNFFNSNHSDTEKTLLIEIISQYVKDAISQKVKF